MKLTDKEGLEIASVVKDVLEGKKAVKEKKKKKLKEVEEPRPEGEKEFKRKHVIKKSGENPDGTVTKEGKEQVDEILGFAKKTVKKAVDKVTGKSAERSEKIQKYKEEIKKLQGQQKTWDANLDKREKEYKDGKIDKEKWEKAEDYYQGMHVEAQQKIEDLKDKIKELQKESVNKEDVDAEEVDQKEAEDKKAKYQKFFQKALKKFGVSSPAELEGEKKKEFFDYVDKNYEGENEAD